MSTADLANKSGTHMSREARHLTFLKAREQQVKKNGNINLKHSKLWCPSKKIMKVKESSNSKSLTNRPTCSNVCIIVLKADLIVCVLVE